MTGFTHTVRRVVVPLAAVATLSQFSTASAQNAEAYYVDNIAALVQESCINCHYTGGIGPSLKFTGSSSSDHQQFDNYVNTPTPGARANTILSKISGMASHGGAVFISRERVATKNSLPTWTCWRVTKSLRPRFPALRLSVQ